MSAGAEVTKGENARTSSFIGAIAIADLVKTTLGPKGMDKILQSVSIVKIIIQSITTHLDPFLSYLISLEFEF